MTINEKYPITNPEPTIFNFISEGKNGRIKKAILYQFMERNRYNLAFGDVEGEKINDKIVSNNNDLVRVISTVAYSIYKFTENRPDVIIEIEGVDEKRNRLYNSLFKRKFKEIEENFDVFGIKDFYQREIYNPDRYYDKFEIQRKK